MKPEEQPCEFPACAVHHICENPCKRNRTETLAKALDDMADVDFDNVFLRSAAHLRALEANRQMLVEALESYDGSCAIDQWDEDLMPSRKWEAKRLAALEQAKELA